MKTFLLPSDPKANYLAHKQEVDQAIHRVLESGRYILSDEAAGFEREFAEYLGVPCAVGVANGTDALWLSLKACGIGPGDAVLTVSHTAVATVAAIELAGAVPVWVDVSPQTFTIDLSHLEDILKKNTRLRVKAVIPVHLYGYPADLPSLMALAKKYNLYIIEDCAQSHGASIQGRKTGTWGHLAAFSFYPTKNLGALGDGGCVVTHDSNLAEKVKTLREYGWKKKFLSQYPGMNSRLDELQAAVLRVKLRYLDSENSRRRELAARYQNLLSSTELILSEAHPDVNPVYHQYVVRSDSRDELQEFLKSSSIGTQIHYPVPLHLQPAYEGRVAVGAGGLPETEKICRQILSLPMHPQLQDSDVDRVGQTITLWHKQRAKKVY